MPFGGYFDSYYEDIITKAVEESGFTPLRADKVYNTQAIIKDIFTLIKQSSFLIADATGKNPNVSYELGVAHALKKPVIIISQTLEDIPFDLKHLRILLYDTKNPRWNEILKLELKHRIKSVIANPKENIAWYDASDDNKLVNFLDSSFLQFKGKISKKCFIECDEKGNCVFEQKWTIYPKTNFTHLWHGTGINKPGIIRVLEVKDLTTVVELDYSIIETTPTELRIFILLEQIKTTQAPFEISLKIYAENYLSNLVDFGEEMTYHKEIQKSKILYEGRTEEYSFPDIPIFENLYAEVITNPDKSIIGNKVYAKKMNNRIKLFLEYNSVKRALNDFSYKLQR